MGPTFVVVRYAAAAVLVVLFYSSYRTSDYSARVDDRRLGAEKARLLKIG